MAVTIIMDEHSPHPGSRRRGHANDRGEQKRNREVEVGTSIMWAGAAGEEVVDLLAQLVEPPDDLGATGRVEGREFEFQADTPGSGDEDGRPSGQGRDELVTISGLEAADSSDGMTVSRSATSWPICCR
jgi:hypothetical protein